MDGQAGVVRLGSILAVAMVAAVLGLGSTPAGAGPDVDWSKAKLVRVIAVEYDFKPNQLTFRHGVAYRLHLENHGKEMHELTAPEFFKSALIQNPDVLARDGTDLVVEPGESKDVVFVPQKPGHYGMICADHDWAGMTGDITVD